MLKRLRVNYSGQVQGVGFRSTARSIAQGLHITGWVRNTNDGGVELVAEGEESALNDLLARIEQELNYTNFRASVFREPASGEYNDFGIKY